MIIWDASKDTGSTDIETMTPIRAVKIIPGQIFIALQNSVQVHSFNRGGLLHKYQTANNLGGILCVSDRQVAFPARVAGQIMIVELATGNVSLILAHDAPLRVLSFSQDGTMLASASEKVSRPIFKLLPLCTSIHSRGHTHMLSSSSTQGTMIHIYNTRNCALITEVRRGMDPAHIYDLCFSPSGALLACTSDKGTLHIFDVPGRSSTHTTTTNATPESPSAASTTFSSGYAGSSRPGSSSSSTTGGGGAFNPGAAENTGWGWLAKVPLLPKAFKDTYSFASAKFELGEEPEGVPDADGFSTLGTTKAQKGVIGWYTEHDLVVVGAGYDARWEKFRMAEQDSGKRFVARIGWKRFYDEKH